MASTPEDQNRANTSSDDEDSDQVEFLDDGNSEREDVSENADRVNLIPMQNKWSPSGSKWRDFLYFVGPGWFVSIAYIDPGNYQADIQAGATSRYQLLWVVWWTSLLSIYVQILCVRLAYYSNMTLAEAQAQNSSKRMRYLNWFIAETSTVITDLPEVIGIGIACNIFFGWPYYVGVILSLVTTMVFLCTLNLGTRVLETIVFLFVGIMSIALFVEMDFVGVHGGELMQGWVYGFTSVTQQDIFAITGIVGAVVMPHNLYLHTAACQARPSEAQYVKEAVRWSSLEPIVPIVMSFFINLAVIAIAAERVYGTENAAKVGISDFCDYFQKLAGGCVLWAIALLAAGQSSAITTTYTGQYVMDGFLQLQLPVQMRAIVTRLVAITPCIIVSTVFPNKMNEMVNIVNSALSFLLPFAFTPLVKFNCSSKFMGDEGCAKGCEKYVLYFFAFVVWLVNALALTLEGGGFFGDLKANTSHEGQKLLITILEVAVQLFYGWWNWNCVRTPVVRLQPLPTSELSAQDINLL